MEPEAFVRNAIMKQRAEATRKVSSTPDSELLKQLDVKDEQIKSMNGQIERLTDRLAAPATLSTHAIDVGAAIELARTLDRLPAELSVIGVEGASFEFDAPLSPAVQRAAGRVATRISRNTAPPT